MRDLHNNIAQRRVISPVALSTTAGGAPKIVDRAGFESVEFIISVGSVTATNATFTPVVKHGDVTGTLTSVADADLLGTEAGATVGAAATRTSGVSKNVVKRVGYAGNKRYVTCALVPTVTAAVPCSVDAVLGHPAHAPAA